MNLKAIELLKEFNSQYTTLHEKFEELYWVFKMGDHSVENQMNAAEKERDAFRSNPNNLKKILDLLSFSDLNTEQAKKLRIWQDFFRLYQTPPELVSLRDEIANLESEIAKKQATQKEGYIDPDSGNFISASKIKISMTMRTNPDERVRKACFDALEKMSVLALEDYIKLVAMRNKYAKTLGFEDFYAYRAHISEGMTKQQIFSIFEELYEGTKNTFEKIRELEKTQLGLRKPWNFSYMMSGQFTLEDDPYYDFKEALVRWGRSFAALGINFQGGSLQLDLLDREGKYNNGFCHYPKIVNFNEGFRSPGSSNFTCNVVYRQPGSGEQGMTTLFHEGGHAADRLNSEETEVCLNTEWPPASIAWAETHSQFLDTMFSSIEWRVRYAKDKDKNPYPFSLFERKVRKLRLLAPISLYSIMFVSEFEKIIYETKELSSSKVLEIAKSMYKKYMDRSEDSVWVLSVPHIYSWDSSGYYHGYGLAELALMQWRNYFYKKYGYIVDNPEVGREMREVWKLGSSKNFADFVKLATGEELSAKAFVEDSVLEVEEYLKRAKDRIKKMESVPEFAGPVLLNAQIKMVHGKKTIADNSVSFEDMANKYADWLKTLN